MAGFLLRDSHLPFIQPPKFQHVVVNYFIFLGRALIHIPSCCNLSAAQPRSRLFTEPRGHGPRKVW